MAVVLNVCETWSLTVKEERRLTLFENRVLRMIFWPKKYEITGEWRRQHNEELNDLYSSPNIFQVIKWRRMKWAGHVVRMEERRRIYRVLVGKSEGKRTLERHRPRWEDNIKMDLQDVGVGARTGSSWLRWRALVDAMMKLWVP